MITGDIDGDGFLLAIAVSTGDTVSFTGLVDTWTNGVPSLVADEKIYFPMVRDSVDWIGESSNLTTADPANVLQAISHTTLAAVTVNADNGHSVEIAQTNDITGHNTINNLNDGERLTATYIASAADRDVDFTAYLMDVTQAVVVTTDLSLVEQAISHSTSGGLTIDADDGHTAEVTMTNDVTGHTINNLAASDVLSVHYLASGGARNLDFTGFTIADELTNPGSGPYENSAASAGSTSPPAAATSPSPPAAPVSRARS